MTAQFDTYEATTDPNGWVQVAVLGGDVHQIDLGEGKSVAQVLADANIEIETGQVVTVNGVPVTDFEQSLEPGTVVNVVSRVKNG